MKTRILLAAALMALAGPASAFAQTRAMTRTTTKTTAEKVTVKVELKEAQPGLTSQATVNIDDAVKTALAARMYGVVTRERIEKRGDRLVYVIGVRTHHKVQNVIVDAKTGAVVKPQAMAQGKAAPKAKKKL